MEIENKLVAMGLSLPPLGEPGGNYIRATRVGNIMFIAGNIAKGPNGILRGRLGENMQIEEAYEGAKLAALNLLATLKAELGDLDRVKRVLKLLCFVNAVPGFVGLPKVSNGASDLLVALYGENGKHARSTVGVASVGGGACIEIEMVVEVE
jgi:enamine deaminase RidA (YjgF/YER057c/UK114 family)